jgi:hypothetical protein
VDRAPRRPSCYKAGSTWVASGNSIMLTSLGRGHYKSEHVNRKGELSGTGQCKIEPVSRSRLQNLGIFQNDTGDLRLKPAAQLKFWGPGRHLIKQTSPKKRCFLRGPSTKLRRRDWLADDPVIVEPVSGSPFPANREINRDFRHFCLCGPDSVLVCRVNSMVCSQIPYSTKQGNVFNEQGNFGRDQGNSLP